MKNAVFWDRVTRIWADEPFRRHQIERRIRLEYPNSSAVAEHSINNGNRIQFHNGSMDSIVKEATEIELHPYNINREGGFCQPN
jgi:hypothetical protein